MAERADDFVLPFQIDRWGLRGRLVRLGGTVDTILGRHDYPPAVGRLLGEATALAACLSSTVKFDGVFTLQAKGEGAVGLLVADVTSAGGVRGYSGYSAEAVARIARETERPSAARLFGGGYLAFTVDQGRGRDRYQGIVELHGSSLAESVHHYFRQSEQIETGLALACDRVDGTHGGESWRAAALMVQRLPDELGSAARPPGAPSLPDPAAIDEGWRRAVTFMGSASERELLDPALSAERLLYRLFHEDGVRVFHKRSVEPTCRCTPGRAAAILKSFPRAEIEELKADGVVTVTCEFCNRSEVFTDDDLDRLYAH
jgi:molecular chaperone Hsp33